MIDSNTLHTFSWANMDNQILTAICRVIHKRKTRGVGDNALRAYVVHLKNDTYSRNNYMVEKLNELHAIMQ